MYKDRVAPPVRPGAHPRFLAQARREGTLSLPVHPVDRPPYRLAPAPADALVRVHVEAPDWAGLVAAATLALSDAVRPLGSFETWSARRMNVRGDGHDDVLERWLTQVLADLAASGFLPAIVEFDRAEPSRAAGILRGGAPAEDHGPAARALRALVPGSVVVEPAEGGRPWRARFDAR